MSDSKSKEFLAHNGDNFVEMLRFCGKHKNFSQWFKSEREFAEHCKRDGGKFKIFRPDGFVVTATKGDLLVKTTYKNTGKYIITVRHCSLLERESQGMTQKTH